MGNETKTVWSSIVRTCGAIVLFVSVSAVFAARVAVNVSPSSVNFGNEQVGSTSAPISVTFTNQGKSVVTVNSVSVNSAQFAAVAGSSLPRELVGGQTVTVKVTFSPAAVERYRSSVAFKQGTQTLVSVAVVGTGIAAKPITVAPVTAPSITMQPASQGIVSGKTATFSVVASGTTPSYQWMSNGAAISGATAASYTTPTETTSASGTQFSVKVNNSAGSVTSSAAVLTVTNPVTTPAISAQPASQSIMSGQTATFFVVASGTTPSYQWMSNGAAISGATAASYTTPTETTSANGTQFSVTVSNSAGSVSSSAAVLTVSTAPSLTASTTSLNFNSVNVGSNSTLGVTLSNAGSTSISISGISLSGAGFSTNGVSSGLILQGGQSATLNVIYAPAATGAVTGSVTITSTASNGTVLINLSGSGAQSVAPTVTLNWDGSTSTVAGYDVFRSTAAGGSYTQLNSSPVSGTQYTDSTVQTGQTYYYVLTAVSSSGVQSTYSNQATVVVP